MKRGLLATVAVLAIQGVCAPAFAQRANENAINAAEDAFGTSIGNETVGLYSSSSARGFNPTQAGNIRIDGLYFDQQFMTQGRIYAGTTMRVGLGAQSYPFPAPTGIADIRLRRPDTAFAGSSSITVGPYKSLQGELELSGPIVPGKLGVLASVTAQTSQVDTRGRYKMPIYGAVFNWTPSDNVDVVAFGQGHYIDSQAQPYILTANGGPPPEYDRSVYFGQDWARRERTSGHFGVLTTATIFDDWLLRAGMFRSLNNLSREHIHFFRNVQPDGTGTLDVLRAVPNHDLSHSAEARLSRTFAEGPRRHTVHFAVRGRDVEHIFGGGGMSSLGPIEIGVVNPLPEPTNYVLAPAGRDDIIQVTPGFSYVGRWQDFGEFSFGIQKSFYRRKVTLPNALPARTESEPWLYNSTLVISLTDAAALYGSYTRGLEESGIAPENALNRGEALPASMTEQIDAGLRYRITPGLSFIAGVFEVTKPYFDRNAANLFTTVGGLSHRGLEFSLSGQLAPGLTVVGGAMLLKARIDAHAGLANLIGPVPAGRPNRNVRLSVQYGPASWNGLSVNGQVNQDGPAYATRSNSLRLDDNTTLDLGMRYVFKLFGQSASLNAKMFNVTNAYGWTVTSSGLYAPTGARRIQAQLIADF